VTSAGSSAATRPRRARRAPPARAANLDVKPLRGSAPWLRLRVGELRVLHRPLSEEEAAAGAGWLIARVIPRGELDRAVASLDT
jgi:hypothetical protein